MKGSVIGGKPTEFEADTNPEKHYGKINNPTVHVALNQLCKLINCLSERFGNPPSEIHVELVRDLKKSTKARNDIASENRKFQKENERRAKLFRELHSGQDPSGLDLKKIRLWEELEADGELGRRCPFSGKVISAAMLFNGEAEIEHILPFSRTLDNSTMNLTIAMKKSNLLKGNKSPYEAFAGDLHTGSGHIWAEIADRIKHLPPKKRERFDADAMDKFNENGGFIARQLTDNAYISRLTKRYLSYICPANRIMTVPGQLTAMMRGKWYLNGMTGDHNYKERSDHRHHAIDAFVVGLTDRSTLNHVSRQSGRGADNLLRINLPDITHLKQQLQQKLDTMVISFKPDHGVNGKMFKETAMGIVTPEKQDLSLKGYDRVARMPLSSLTKKQLHGIRNPGWRDLVLYHVKQAEEDGQKLDKNGLIKVLEDFSQKHGVKRVRVLLPNQSSTVITHNGHQKAYAPDSYACVDIWQEPKGKKGKWQKDAYVWKGAFWSYADCKAENLDDKGRPIKERMVENGTIHPAAKFITRLFKDDLIEICRSGTSEIMRVGSYSATDNRIDLRPQYQTESKQAYISINVLKDIFIRRLHVLPDGRIRG